MALINCSECAKQVSDRATACPHCGAPLGSAPFRVASAVQPQPARISSGRVAKGVLTVLLGGLALVVVRGAAFPAMQSAGLAPAARWIVDNAGGDDGCSVLGEYCMRIRCAVTNAGNASGTARIAAVLLADKSPPVTHRATVVLAPGQQDTVVMTFPEAKMRDKHQYSCSLE